MTIFTVDRYGRPGMPTFNIKKIRRFLKSGKAEIFRHHPFTVRLLYAESLDVQSVEMCIDAGDRHIGISVISRKHEFAHSQYDPLPDEKERHEDRRRYRRMRRDRLRCRKPRFDNRRKPEDWLAPTVEHKKDLHVGLAVMFKCVCPLTSVTVETGSFDTQELERAPASKGDGLPTGAALQGEHAPRCCLLQGRPHLPPVRREGEGPPHAPCRLLERGPFGQDRKPHYPVHRVPHGGEP